MKTSLAIGLILGCLTTNVSAKTGAEALAERRSEFLAKNLSEIKGDIVCSNQDVQVVLAKNLSRATIQTNKGVKQTRVISLQGRPDWFGRKIVSFMIPGLDHMKQGGIVSEHILNIDVLNKVPASKAQLDAKFSDEVDLSQSFILEGGYISSEGNIVVGQGASFSPSNFPRRSYTCKYQ